MNWGGLSVAMGIALMVYLALPYSLAAVAAVGLWIYLR